MALAVLATALGALIRGGSDSALGASHLRDKTFAHWVAQNQITEMQITGAWPDVGTTKGEEKMVGQRWLWSTTISKTPEESVNKIEVSVRHESQKQPIATVAAFLARPEPKEPEIPPPPAGGVPPTPVGGGAAGGAADKTPPKPAATR